MSCLQHAGAAAELGELLNGMCQPLRAVEPASWVGRHAAAALVVLAGRALQAYTLLVDASQGMRRLQMVSDAVRVSVPDKGVRNMQQGPQQLSERRLRKHAGPMTPACGL